MDRTQDQQVTITDVDQTITASGNSAAVADTKDFHSASFFVDVGLWTDGTHTFHLEDSPDNSVWTDVPASQQVGTAVVSSLTTDGQLYELGYVGGQRYLRLAWDVTGATSGVAGVDVGYILSHAANAPV